MLAAQLRATRGAVAAALHRAFLTAAVCDAEAAAAACSLVAVRRRAPVAAAVADAEVRATHLPSIVRAPVLNCSDETSCV